MNRHALQVLEFPAVLDVVARRATSELGKAAIRSLEPGTDRRRIERALARVDAAHAFLVRSEGWGLPPIPELRVELKRLAKPGSFWEARTLLDGARLLRSSSATRDALGRHVEELSSLRGIWDRLVALDRQAKAIERAIDEAGEVQDAASPELARIRRELRAQRSTIVERLERFMASLPAGVRVEDASVTVREGRYVVPV
ncbi:MAG: hypothetical protein ACOCVZ_06775, partial [Gemmatimonadota bacterium]